MTEIGYKNGEIELAPMHVFDTRGAQKELQDAQNLLAQYKAESRSIKIAIGDVIRIGSQTSVIDALTKILVQYELKKQKIYQKMEEKDEQIDEKAETQTRDENATQINKSKMYVGSLTNRIAGQTHTLGSRYKALLDNKAIIENALLKIQDTISKVTVGQLLVGTNESEKSKRKISKIRQMSGKLVTAVKTSLLDQDVSDIELEELDESITNNVVHYERSPITFGKGTIEFNVSDEMEAEADDEIDVREIVEMRYQKTRGNLIESIRRNVFNLIAIFDKGNTNKENVVKSKEIELQNELA